MKALPCLLLLLAASTAQAEIYQWKDEKGRIHFGEEVPAKYQKAAKPVTPGPLNTMPAQKGDAQPVPNDAPESSGPAPGDPARDARAGTPEDVCREQMARYQASQACFARYRNANGSVRPQGFQECEPVAQPTDCKIVTN
ncbi:MAG: hypothetical protein K0S16_960 [Moraxellaceae bacterium]|jgi:hypothetical protein|nr:hypothetical protein [Moraxellaceae bacterium]